MYEAKRFKNVDRFQTHCCKTCCETGSDLVTGETCEVCHGAGRLIQDGQTTLKLESVVHRWMVRALLGKVPHHAKP